jgi:hypothetical protein
MEKQLSPSKYCRLLKGKDEVGFGSLLALAECCEDVR